MSRLIDPSKSTLPTSPIANVHEQPKLGYPTAVVAFRQMLIEAKIDPTNCDQDPPLVTGAVQPRDKALQR
ncbi:hypothetical protein LMTR13_07660 [Bradyrhizobium icense]|uniref:Uncharacterized protein n=1 Tax=Bradyrhizobium icense TaxID=1274631 RepID=A0A1B1UBC1_9BRAD|nr:hypothetical protein LMTR13_07660 [Bradyrhizobium icense]